MFRCKLGGHHEQELFSEIYPLIDLSNSISNIYLVMYTADSAKAFYVWF